ILYCSKSDKGKPWCCIALIVHFEVECFLRDLMLQVPLRFSLQCIQCFFQVSFASTKISRNLVCSTCSNRYPSIDTLNLSTVSGMCLLPNSMKLIFLLFHDYLFALNQFDTFANSELTIFFNFHISSHEQNSIKSKRSEQFIFI